MNSITLDAFTDELEKISGLRRVQRIARAGLKAMKQPHEFLNTTKMTKGLQEAGERAGEKLRRRAGRYAGGTDGWLSSHGLNSRNPPAGATSMAEAMLHAKPRGA